MFVYAVGADHPLRDPCREIVRRAGARELRGEASVDALQEFAHQRMRRTGDRAEAVRNARAIAGLCRLLETTPVVALAALDVLATNERLTARDATFVALAAAHGISVILTPDTDFDGLDGLRRVDPADAGAVDALARG